MKGYYLKSHAEVPNFFSAGTRYPSVPKYFFLAGTQNFFFWPALIGTQLLEFARYPIPSGTQLLKFARYPVPSGKFRWVPADPWSHENDSTKLNDATQQVIDVKT